jgi:hypothetical protein
MITRDNDELLEKLCKKHSFSFIKMKKLIDMTREYELRGSRSGIFESLKEVIVNRNIK